MKTRDDRTWIELAGNLAALMDVTVHASRYQLLGHPLSSSAGRLGRRDLTGAGARAPAGATSDVFHGGVRFYTRGGVQHEFSLANQFDSVQRHGGWLRYGPYGFRVRLGRIVEFHFRAPDAFERVRSHADVLAHFGEPIRVNSQVDTGEVMWSEFVYARGVRVLFDEWDARVSAVNVGEGLQFGAHGHPKVPESLFDPT